MQSNDKPKERGRFIARVEFLAVREDVQRFLEEGHSLKAIYDFYHEKGAFTMRYQTFCSYAAGKIPATGPRSRRTVFSKEVKPSPAALPAPAMPPAVKQVNPPPREGPEPTPPAPTGPQILEVPAANYGAKLPDENI